MVIMWQKQARLDLHNYYKHTDTLNPKEYISNLIDYVDTLKVFPDLGKNYIKIYDYEIKVLFYKMHKIYYYVKDNQIHIIKAVHTHINEDTILKIISEIFKN